jgi:caffeoyl-CoA O-methyltransferase
MPLKYVSLNDGLYRYLSRCRSDAADPILQELRADTAALGDISQMQISEEQGTFMGMLVALVNAGSVIEIGTFTGYSALCMARALPANGRLVCVDQSQEWTDIARKYWRKAGVEDRIDLRLGPAIPMLQQLPPNLGFDVAFIDAEKTEYDAYYELILPRIRRNGLLIFDNMLWGGRLGAGPIQEDSGRVIDALNHKLAMDKRIESVLLPVADGLHFCRKL